jgi:hypothetical protein
VVRSWHQEMFKTVLKVALFLRAKSIA